MPTMPSWQLQNPINAIVFDCDGTLSAIEGIDELAKQHNVGKEVEALTAEAMGQAGMSPALYQKRLELVQPTKDQVLALGRTYYANLVPHADAVIKIFQSLNKSVYIASAGIRLAVTEFGRQLNIPDEHILAVDVHFNESGHYSNFNIESPLTHFNGKRDIAETLLKTHGSIAHIGDGMNDFVVRDVVTRFIGYGGIYRREHIAKGCQFYITAKSLAAMLPLILTPAEFSTLDNEGKDLYQSGLNDIVSDMVLIQS